MDSGPAREREWYGAIPLRPQSSGGGAGYTTLVLLNSMRTTNATYGQTAPPNGWGYCGTGSGPSNWDQNLDSTGRHCLDQVGMGQGDFLTGGFSSDGSGSNNVTNSATSCISIPHLRVASSGCRTSLRMARCVVTSAE